MPRFRGWSIVGYVVAGLAGFGALVFALAGWNEAAVRFVVRSTARTAVILFLMAFGASALKRFFPARPTRWLRRNRRYVGVSFAAAHFLHLAMLVTLAVAYPDPFVRELQAVTLIGGGLAYAFIAAMAATSFDRTAAWLGPQRWRRLHTVGGYYVWIVFTQSYIGRALVDPYYIPFAFALLAVLTLRVAHRVRKPRLVAPT